MTSPHPERDRDQNRDQPAEDRRPAASFVPQTGEPEVDRALESLQGLESAPLDEHHDRLARAHEDLHRALNRQDQA